METLSWQERPFISIEQMADYSARDQNTERKYGPTVKGGELSNRDYSYRYERFSASRKMKPPPGSHMHIYLGYLVVRKLGTQEQYETWMPGHVFEELYAKKTDS